MKPQGGLNLTSKVNFKIEDSITLSCKVVWKKLSNLWEGKSTINFKRRLIRKMNTWAALQNKVPKLNMKLKILKDKYMLCKKNWNLARKKTLELDWGSKGVLLIMMW